MYHYPCVQYRDENDQPCVVVFVTSVAEPLPVDAYGVVQYPDTIDIAPFMDGKSALEFAALTAINEHKWIRKPHLGLMSNISLLDDAVRSGEWEGVG